MRDARGNVEPGYLVDDANWIVSDLPDVDGIDHALEFDGDGDIVELGNDAALYPGDGGFSFATWVKIADTGAMSIISRMVKKLERHSKHLKIGFLNVFFSGFSAEEDWRVGVLM